MSKSFKEVREKLEKLKTNWEENDNEIDKRRLEIVALESEQREVLGEMEKLGKLLEGDEESVTLSDLAELESLCFQLNNTQSSFVLESYREFDDAGWMVEVGFTTATDAYNFLNSAMFERLFENGYAEKYRVIRASDDKVMYFKESEHVGD